MSWVVAVPAALVAGPALAGFGAIAYSASSGGYGVGEAAARGEAERAAMADCAGYGRDCAVTVAFENACGALARAGAAHASASAGALGAAEAAALAACRRLSASGCEIEVSFCARR